MSKYHAIPIYVDGIRFASKAEARRYCELRLLERAGGITEFILQPRFPLTVNGVKLGTYVADFQYHDCATGQSVIEDVKGVLTPVYKLKCKLIQALYGVVITEVQA